MAPTPPSRPEAPIQGSSPYHPPLSGAELAQRTISSPSIMGNRTTDQENLIFSPIPTRPRPSQVAEVGPSTTSVAMEVDTTPHDVLAQLHQYIDQGPSTPVANTVRLRHLSRTRQRQHQRQHLENEKPIGVERIRERRDQRRDELIARRHRQRRSRTSSTDALADNLSTLSTNESERNSREESRGRIRRQDREIRHHQIRKARGHSSAGRAQQQVRDVEQSIHGRADGVRFEEGDGSASGTMDTDVQRTDNTCVSGGPTEDSDVQMFNPQFPSHKQSEED